MALIRHSEKLMDDTIHGRQQEVAAAMNGIRQEEYTLQYCNSEQALYIIGGRMKEK